MDKKERWLLPFPSSERCLSVSDPAAHTRHGKLKDASQGSLSRQPVTVPVWRQLAMVLFSLHMGKKGGKSLSYLGL